jgi:hypothetical protein
MISLRRPDRSRRSRAAPLRAAALAALLAPAAFAAVTTAANTVFAQTPPAVTSRITVNEVEVGEAFSVELKAMSETGESVSNPELRPPPGFSISGPMISTQSFMQFGGGARHVQSGIGATWNLVPSAPGTYTIPAPTVVWNGQRLKGSPMTIKVVPQGSRPPRQPGGFLFPGGMPGGSLFGPNWPFGTLDQDDEDDSRDQPNLALSRAPNEDIFLHATADKTSAVIGEQVTVSIYRYFQYRSIRDLRDNTPMRLEDFLRYSLTNDTASQTTQTAHAGSKRFNVRLIEKLALFPLRAGQLHTGPFLETYWPPNNSRNFMRRSSEDLVIQVSEPPAANRPVGYRLGDVGQFQIAALVQPRRVEEGGSVAVNVKITGTGNFPASLRVPEKTGVEWLDPEKKESIEPKNGEIGGFRSFGYVVRLTKTGAVDLGTIELPYWNPRAKRYEVARSALGVVDVSPASGAKAAPTAAPSATADKDEAFASLPPPRTALSPFRAPSEGMLLEGPRFGAALAAPPLLALAGIAGVEVARRARSRLADRKTSPRTLATAALADARQSKKKGDERAAAAAVERAIVLAIEAACGVKARGVLKEELATELRSRGIGGGVADRASDALAACDRARFDPLAAAEVRIEDAEALVRDLLAARA